MKLRKIFKNKLAFSLVELVVVIAIMAILAGAVAGAVVGVRDSANKNEVETAGAEVAKQLELLLNDGATSKTKDAAAVVTALKGMLSGFGASNANIYTGTVKAPEDGQKYLRVISIASGGLAKGDSTFKVYTSKKQQTITFHGTTGLVEKGSVEAYSA